MTTPTRTYTSTDPDRLAAEVAREHDALAGMLAGVSERVDAHDLMIGRNGEALAALVREAVAAAIVQTASDPAVWAAMRKAMVTQTKEAAGGWLLDGISGIGTKVFWVAVAICGLYLVGGLPLLLKTIKGFATQAGAP